MKQAAARLRAANVGVIYLVHGTFVGTDTAGLLGAICRFVPRLRGMLGRIEKFIADLIFRDNGNYLPRDAKLLEQALNPDGEVTIPVRLFNWSSENHHIARADAAVRLLAELASLRLPPGKRILCWGHSHGGNVLALLTNLLAGPPGDPDVAAFFAAAETFYRRPISGTVDLPVWDAVRQLLADPRRPVLSSPLDLVTFGTPIRYGWDVAGCDKLLHFVHHQPLPGLPPERTGLPTSTWEFLFGTSGDYVQQYGIAGTNFLPFPLWWRAFLADRRLNSLLQPDCSWVNLFTRICRGVRVPESGTTLLVDYGKPVDQPLMNARGHAVYTKRRWLPFHLNETARIFYGNEPAKAPHP